MSNYTKINVRVTDQSIQKENYPLIASGGVNNVKVHFTFCSLWNGLAKTAVFYADPKQARRVLLEDDAAIVPPEVIDKDGAFCVGVFGVNDDQVFPSNFVRVTILKGAASVESVDPAEPTPDIYQQMAAAYGRLASALAVEKARVNEILAIRGVDGAVEYPIESGGFSGTITSNGIFAHIMLDGAPTLEANGPTIFSQLIPSRFAPLSAVELTCGYPGVTVRIGTVSEDAEYANLIFFNATDSVIEDYFSLTGEYVLAAVAIPELSDVRVSHDGTTYPTAGDAVRAQIADPEIVISYEEQDGAWRTVSDYAEVLARIQAGKTTRITLRNITEGYECQATKVEHNDQDSIIYLHTAVGVFAFADDDTIEKVSEPESGSCVLTGSGAPTGDTPGELDQLYMNTQNGMWYKSGGNMAGRYIWESLPGRKVFKFTHPTTSIESGALVNDGGLTYAETVRLFNLGIEIVAHVYCAAEFSHILLPLTSIWEDDMYLIFSTVSEGILYEVQLMDANAWFTRKTI